MKDEIKEILDEFESLFEISEAPEHIINDFNKIRNCITNLQEEVENLRESNWAWHQTLKAQNKREYRSKFLKEFQQEYNTNTFPDYDEIYKRYDKLKEENKRLKEINERRFKIIDTIDNALINLDDYIDTNSLHKYLVKKVKENHLQEGDIEFKSEIKELNDYKSRNEKAIENIDLVIELIKQQPTEDDSWILNKLNGFKYLLNGGDKDEYKI